MAERISCIAQLLKLLMCLNSSEELLERYTIVVAENGQRVNGEIVHGSLDTADIQVSVDLDAFLRNAFLLP